MLLSLHVKNLALIEEEEVTFTDGLNILTGETGAGKSIIIGSVNLALGGKADKAIIRTGAEYALIEMVFQTDNDRQLRKLEEMDLPAPEDGTILIKRKILPGRSVCSVCGESVTLRQLREIAELMIDIYGQRENQKLLRREAQLQTVDEFAGDTASGLKEKVGDSYSRWKSLKAEWEKDDLDDAARKREADLLTYECNEISEAAVREGEDGELENRFRLMENFRRISEAAGQTGMWTGGSEHSAEEAVDRAARELASVSGIDPGLDKLADELSEIENLLSDFNRSLNDYIRELTFDPSEFEQIRDRLNLINHLKDKYGRSIEDILNALREREERLAFLEDYENGRNRLRREIDAEYAKLLGLCEELSKVRREAAESFGAKLSAALMDLNFPQVEFESRINSGEEYISAGGYDRLVFYISMNPGESMRPLDQIASGGELSRIMLGMKTVFAGKDEIHTFIFDEIDTGISGKTAWKVAEKMGRLSADHQILCITHLPQIASMQDSHYCIVKESVDGRTMTHINRLSEEESDREIARLLGSDHITEAALETRSDVEFIVNKILAGFKVTRVDEIPAIDLYMDQVLTFLGERLRRTARKSDADKLLTKTMVNNYVKNKVMIPPVKKKYGRDHILLLMVIYYMKSFLSIDDIRSIVGPVSDKYAQPTTKSAEQQAAKRHRYSMSDVYTELFGYVSRNVERFPEEVEKILDETDNAFMSAPEEDREMLRRFNVICQLSADIYLRKLLIEKLLDETPGVTDSGRNSRTKT